MVGQDQIDPDIPLKAWNRLYDLLGPTERQGAERVLKRDTTSVIPEPAPSFDLLEVEGQGERSTAVSEERDADGNAVDVSLRKKYCIGRFLPGCCHRLFQFRLSPRDEHAVASHPVNRFDYHGVAELAAYRRRVISGPKAERPGGGNAVSLQQLVRQHLIAGCLDTGSAGSYHQLTAILDHRRDRFEPAARLWGYQECGIRLIDHPSEALRVAVPAVNNLKAGTSVELWEVSPIDLYEQPMFLKVKQIGEQRLKHHAPFCQQRRRDRAFT